MTGHEKRGLMGKSRILQEEGLKLSSRHFPRVEMFKLQIIVTALKVRSILLFSRGRASSNYKE